MNPPDTMIKAMMRGEAADLRSSFASFQEREASVLALLQELAQRPRVRVVYPHQSLCNAEICQIVRDGMPLYTDDNHLGTNGVALIQRELTQAVDATDQLSRRN
jgi:hypothetical protein